MSNPLSTTTARLFFGHICKESKAGRLLTTKEFETARQSYPAYEINDVDNLGNTVLHVAAAIGNVNLINTIFKKAKGLLDQINNRGQTPFYKAIQNSQLEAAEALLEYGASVTVIAEGVLCYWDKEFHEITHCILFGETCYEAIPNYNTFNITTTTQMSLLAFSVDRVVKSFSHSLAEKAEKAEKNVLQLLLQYKDLWEDSDRLSDQIVSYNVQQPGARENLKRTYSRICSEIIKKAEDSIAEKRERFVQLLSDFMAADTANLVVQYTYIK